MATKSRVKPRRKAAKEERKRYSRSEIERYNLDLIKHFGRWVCVVGYRVVAVGDDPMDALAKAHQLGYKKARVKRAPLNPSARLLVA